MFYKLEKRVADKHGVIQRLSNNKKYKKNEFYQEKINRTELAELDDIIRFEIDLLDDEPNIIRDYHGWSFGRPTGYHIACSPKYNSTLSKLSLPKHSFYNAEIDLNKKTQKYSVLHFIQKCLQDIDYKKSQFAEIFLLKSSGGTSRLCEVGEIKSEKHYHQLNKKLVEDMKYLQPKIIYFRPEINYDVWGLRGQIIISERAKRQIEKDQITGVEMINLKDTEMFKDLEVIFSNPDYGK